MGGRKLYLRDYPFAHQSRDERPMGGKKLNISEYPDENSVTEKKQPVKKREPIKK